MTKHNELDDNALDALYQKRKARYQSPSSVKQEVLSSLATTKPASTPWWRVNLMPYMQVSAITCTIAVAFIVISLQVVENEHTSIIAQTVELHELAPLNDAEVNRAVQQRYEQSLTSELLSSRAKTQQRAVQYERAQHVDLAVHQQMYATVLQNKDGLSLLTCDKSLLKLSQEVVDILLPRRGQSDINFEKGQVLALAFDDKGHIINITQEKSKTSC